MKNLFLKCLLYLLLVIIALEVLVRVFHLYTEVPIRYIDEFGVEKSLPNQTGYAVTGNRRQNHSEYRINDFGFNSFREFDPTKEKTEIALVGDSFIEGMHQDYDDSTGAKIEKKLNGEVHVYEFGYAGYDLSNQLHLIDTYKEKFKFIDYIIIYLKYDEDLDNEVYTPNKERIALLSSPLFKIRDNFKLLSYCTKIGLLDPVKDLAIQLTDKNKSNSNKNEKSIQQEKDSVFLDNFKKLISFYGFDKNKSFFLLNSSDTPLGFLDYCKLNGINIIDYNEVFKKSSQPPILIYDQHWNNHGRELVAQVISEALRRKLN